MALAGADFAQIRRPTAAEIETFIAAVVGVFPGMVCPIASLGTYGPYVLAAVDLFCGLAAGVLTIIAAVANLGPKSVGWMKASSGIA